MTKLTWPCPGKPEDLKGQPIGMYHCEFCGEMQLAGVSHIPPQFPSDWEEPFPKIEEPDEDDEIDEPIEESGMVSYHRSPVMMETLEAVGPPHTRPPLTPPSSFPTASTCPSCAAYSSVTFTQEEERFLYGAAPNSVELTAIVVKGRCASCQFEFTDWRAENARDEAVQAYLKSKS